jgi:hypothetical protein
MSWFIQHGKKTKDQKSKRKMTDQNSKRALLVVSDSPAGSIRNEYLIFGLSF